MRFGALGDMVLLTVLLRHLHARFGQRVDVISSGPWTHPLLEGQSAVGRLMLIGSRRTPYWLSVPKGRLVKWLRERGPGPTWFCDLSSRGKELLHRGGICDEQICDSREFPWVRGESFADRYIRLGNVVPPGLEGRIPGPITGTERAARIEVSEAARESARAWLGRHGLAGRRFIAVHAGSRHVARRWLRSRAGASKYWPEARWGAVVRALRDFQPDHAVLLSGTPAEYGFNADIAREAGVSDLHNVANDLPIPMMLPVLEQAASMVSVDTGPAHAAAALGCPTVSLFGTANADLFRPGGATTRAIALTGTVDGRQNILGITPDAVISAWKSLVFAAGSGTPRDGRSASSG